MNKMKMAFWLVMVGLFGMVVFQNQGYFMAKHGLEINLLFTEYQVPQFPNLLFLMIFFIIGFLIAYVFSLYEKFRNSQTLKNLNHELVTRAEAIARLETENDSLKSAMTEMHSKTKAEEKVIPEEENMVAPDREPKV
jgi:hypothetical protein